MSELKEIIIYTDGACHGNPGPGGYAAILLHGSNRRELSGGCSNTTNNRMEILAAIKGLEALKERCAVILYSDSKYLVDSMMKGWVRRWQANGWKRNKRDRAQNVDLWEQLLVLCEAHDVVFEWTRGHAGTPENERCDYLANEAARREDLPNDPIHSQPSQGELL
ncbi:ribonuclease HI [bacterium]|nr:ribonuclease HI [bacterium]